MYDPLYLQKPFAMSLEEQIRYAEDRVGQWWRIEDPTMNGKLIYRRVEKVQPTAFPMAYAYVETRVLHLTTVETGTGIFHSIDISSRVDSVRELVEWKAVTEETVTSVVAAWQARQQADITSLLSKPVS